MKYCRGLEWHITIRPKTSNSLRSSWHHFDDGQYYVVMRSVEWHSQPPPTKIIDIW